MSLLKSEGNEIARFFDQSVKGLISIRDNGSTLIRQVGTPWRLFSRKVDSIPLREWIAEKRAAVNQLPSWMISVRHLPTLPQLHAWKVAGISSTPTGYEVEPDGIGPDSVPSWLRLFGLV
jgi:hypothetical protein